MTVRRWHGGDTLPAAPERVACAVHFQDVHMVGEAIQQRASESFWPKDLSPLVEGQVGGHEDDAPLIGLAEDLELIYQNGDRCQGCF